MASERSGMAHKRLSGVRLKLYRAYREYRAILVLTNMIPSEKRSAIDRSLAKIPAMSGNTAKKRLGELLGEVAGARIHFGVRASADELQVYADAKFLAEKVRKLDNEVPGQSHRLIYFPKHLLSRMFSHYDRAFLEFDALPPHAQVGVDVFGVRPDRTVDVHLLDAKLFEDMAALFNAAIRKANDLDRLESPSKPELKLSESLIRSAGKAAFNLIEGYINGLAQDILLSRETTQSEREMLSEWDETRDRAKTLSLRDKILQYPKLALSLQHPPIDEGRSLALKRMLELEKRVRHSLIHPTPRPERGSEDFDRQFEFWAFGRDQLVELCDSVVEVIFEIDQLLDGRYGRASYWMSRRESDGLFSDKVFF